MWFPAVLWMLTILDQTDGTIAANGVGAVVLGGFALMFFVMLRIREARRIALWQTVATTPLGNAKPPELLRRPPQLEIARATWGVTLGALTIAGTAWLAPKLWRQEAVHHERVAARELSAFELPCCPLDLDVQRTRVREYFDLGRGHDASSGQRRRCRACAAPSRIAMQRCASINEPGCDVAVPAQDNAPSRRYDRQLHGPVSVVTNTASSPPSDAGPATPAPPPTSPPAPVSQPPPAAPPVSSAPTGRMIPTTTAIAAGAVGEPSEAVPSPPIAPGGTSLGSSLVSLLITLATAVVLFQLLSLGLRPLRRLITLRHLRRPLWDETVDQRVSNSWQLALIGLRDAGWRVAAGEQPQALARRVGSDSLESCATILERARHGLGIDAEDLAAMRSSADAAYDLARASLGLTERIVGWLRWPLA